MPGVFFALFAIFAVKLGPAAGRQGSTFTVRLPVDGAREQGLGAGG